MKLHVLGSSSTGNGYLLYNRGEALVIEAGIRLRDVKQVLDFRIDIIAGCIVSHGHQDHAAYVKEYADAGIDLLAPKDVFTNNHHRNHAAIAGKGYKMRRFCIIPFEVTHDVTCYGYLIDHPDTGRILFLTDTYLCEYKFSGLNHILIEANYADDILESNIFNGIEHPSIRDRLLTSHLELKTTLAILKANDLSFVRNIVLIHLSDRNSDEQRFIREVITHTGKQVYAAKKGLAVDFAINPF